MAKIARNIGAQCGHRHSVNLISVQDRFLRNENIENTAWLTHTLTHAHHSSRDEDLTPSAHAHEPYLNERKNCHRVATAIIGDNAFPYTLLQNASIIRICEALPTIWCIRPNCRIIPHKLIMLSANLFIWHQPTHIRMGQWEWFRKRNKIEYSGSRFFDHRFTTRHKKIETTRTRKTSSQWSRMEKLPLTSCIVRNSPRHPTRVVKAVTILCGRIHSIDQSNINWTIMNDK